MSSFYEDASLVMIPSGYKTSKVYCAKPTDGAGDLTFIRSNDTATRVNSAGLIEKVRTNLVPNGLSFFAATGVLYTTVTSDSPISGVSSTRITKNEAAGTLRYGNQNASASALTGSISYTISRYFKYDGYNLTTSMEFNNSAQWGGISWTQNINIASTGVTLQAPSNCTSKITNVGNGWYRVDVTIVNGASPSGSPVTYLLKVDSTLSTGQGFLTAAPQLETGDIATDYILTTTAAVSVGPVANVPRLDYLNSSCPRLLLEPQRVNIFPKSESSDTWSFTNMTRTGNHGIAPDGYQSADLLAPTTSGVVTFTSDSTTSSLTIGQPFVCSFFIKLNQSFNSNAGQNIIDLRLGGSALWARPTVRINLATGSVTEIQNASYLSSTNYGNGWFRITFGAIPTGTTSSTQLQIPTGTTMDGGSFYIWGLQGEANATYATSYIPTLGAAVTRGADAASKTGISSLIGQTQGTIYLEADIQKYNESGFYVAISAGAVLATSIYLFQPSSGNLQVLIRNSGNPDGQIVINSANWTAGFNKVAIAYTATTAEVFINGVSKGSTSFVSAPACSNFNLAARPDILGSLVGAGPYSQALLFKTRLSNSELAALTTL